MSIIKVITRDNHLLILKRSEVSFVDIPYAPQTYESYKVDTVWVYANGSKRIRIEGIREGDIIKLIDTNFRDSTITVDRIIIND